MHIPAWFRVVIACMYVSYNVQTGCTSLLVACATSTRLRRSCSLFAWHDLALRRVENNVNTMDLSEGIMINRVAIRTHHGIILCISAAGPQLLCLPSSELIRKLQYSPWL